MAYTHRRDFTRVGSAVPRFAPDNHRRKGGCLPAIKPTFVAPFGRYVLGPVNVYDKDPAGHLFGRTINDVEERDALVRVRVVVPFWVYRVELVDSTRKVIALLKTDPAASVWHTVHFGILG